MSGPTSVPWRVITPSIASSRGSIRFITLMVSPTIFVSDALPVVLGGDEERRLPGVAVRRLHDEVVAEPGGAREGRAARRRSCPLPIDVGHARHARLVRRAASSRSSSRADAAATPAGTRPRAPARCASSSVSSSNIRNATLPPGPRRPHVVDDLLVPEQVVADLLDRLELARLLLVRHEHVRMPAVERVVVVDELEVAHPAIDPEQVERGRATRSRSASRSSGRTGGSPGCRGAVGVAARRAVTAAGSSSDAAVVSALGGVAAPRSAHDRQHARSRPARRAATSPVDHDSPHQSRMNSPRTCAVCTTDGRYTRSSTPCACSA